MTATRNDDSSRPLNDKQQRFVLEYLQDQNAAAAARRAGYSDSTRGSHAATLMKNPLIRERINEEMAALFARLRVNAFSILQAQSRAAFFDPRKMFDTKGEPVPISQLDEDTACALNVSYDSGPRGKTLRVRQAPRHVALAALENRYATFLEMELRAVQVRCERQAQCDEAEVGIEASEVEPAAAPRFEVTSPPARAAESLGVPPAPPPSMPVHASRAARRAALKRTGANWRASGLLRGLLTPPPASADAASGNLNLEQEEPVAA
jgi:hypothetical protein